MKEDGIACLLPNKKIIGRSAGSNPEGHELRAGFAS
jgi:hypothetical protein